MNESTVCKIRIIAFYLPQYHPTPQNDYWWGKGFTEWTNVEKAKPLFRGHEQPRIPTDLGYYDLRMPEVREKQVELAKKAGVYGFCYWHYWFGNGNRLLEKIFDDVLLTGRPDFPFCLGWANHSWYKKKWSPLKNDDDELIVAQTYPGVSDARLHFEFLLKAFKDKRYIKVNSMPLLYVFDPKGLPKLYIEYFNKWAIEAGFDKGLYIVGNISSKEIDKSDLLIKGYNAVSYQRLTGVIYDHQRKLEKVFFRIISRVKKYILNIPEFTIDYRKAMPFLLDDNIDSQLDVIPSIIPNWDHTPRSGRNGSLFINSTPCLFKQHAKRAMDIVSKKPVDNRIIFLKSWNEWGEGNYMEPDSNYGHGYIEALGELIHNNNPE